MNTSHKIGFYPCCCDDIAEPRNLLAGLVDEIIFCDKSRPASWAKHQSCDDLPSIRFVQGDVRDQIPALPLIHVFFYRNDSRGEGGSGVYLLGKEWLKQILDHFPDEGGLIVTDGKNSGGHVFSKMIRPAGYFRQGWKIRFDPRLDHPWLENHGLYVIKVTKNAAE